MITYRSDRIQFGLSTMMWAIAGFACLFAILRSRSASIALAIAVTFVVWTILFVASVCAERRLWWVLWCFASGLGFPALFVVALSALK